MSPPNQAFLCGACQTQFSVMIQLHSHLQTSHNTSGSYIYHSDSKTAYPKYETICKASQTEEDPFHYFMINNIDGGDTSRLDDNSSDVNETGQSGIIVEEETLGGIFDEDDLQVFSEELAEFVNKPFSDDDNNDYIEEQDIMEDPELESHSNTNISVEAPAINRNAKVKKSNKNVKTKKRIVKQVNAPFQTVQVDTTEWMCDLCSITFDSKQVLQSHKHSNHQFLENGKVKCDMCCKQFTTRAALKRHVLIHLGLTPFSCDGCDKKFRTAGELNHHKLSHSADYNYICQYCGGMFPSPSNLRLHILQCQDIRPFKCKHNDCHQTFRTNTSLVLHERRHTGESPYICDRCGDTFSRADKLVKHRYIHSGSKPFPCNICTKTFATKDHLQRHERIHSQNLPFVCSHCGKGFSQNWNLKSHLRQHSGDKPYKCEMCGLNFTHNVSKKSHIAKVHGKVTK